MTEKVRCGAPRSRGRDGVCNRLASTAYCPEHMYYADIDSIFKVIFEDDRVLVVRACRLGDVCDFIDSDVSISEVL